ncbi:hypothetical protein CPLU01_07727 [Colletotrichum plurivorum]|uniref:Uncharacterized protein n=1 Tax=Colletotrichum plurivorum TaxID=2175906 RepID=A0A8H6KE39_9PEZI|nr:hypothetical protein CPLU01_07727 [Colletotrichum plurivorum]
MPELRATIRTTSAQEVTRPERTACSGIREEERSGDQAVGVQIGSIEHAVDLQNGEGIDSIGATLPWAGLEECAPSPVIRDRKMDRSRGGRRKGTRAGGQTIGRVSHGHIDIHINVPGQQDNPVSAKSRSGVPRQTRSKRVNGNGMGHEQERSGGRDTG